MIGLDASRCGPWATAAVQERMRELLAARLGSELLLPALARYGDESGGFAGTRRVRRGLPRLAGGVRLYAGCTCRWSPWDG